MLASRKSNLKSGFYRARERGSGNKSYYLGGGRNLCYRSRPEPTTVANLIFQPMSVIIVYWSNYPSKTHQLNLVILVIESLAEPNQPISFQVRLSSR
jgi:hypothetical protein